MSHTNIRNRFKKSPLPRNQEIAEALRNGDTTLEALAAEHGVAVKTITKRLQVAGWDAGGNVIPPWLLTPPSGIHVCRRCGRERQVKKADTAEMCGDCRSVEKAIA
jgi:lambda repressor-like predicted transcriptional regulator